MYPDQGQSSLTTITTNLATADGKVVTVDGIVDTLLVNQLNRVRYLVVPCTDPADQVADTVLATVGSGTVVNIESIIVRATGAQTADMTSIAIYGGAAKIVTFLDSTAGARTNLAAADQQQVWSGNVVLPAAATIVLVHAGTSTGALALAINIKYRVISGTNGLA